MTLSGIGSQTAKCLSKLGINQIQDLLFHLPIRYEDRTRVYPIGSITAGMTVLICGIIEITDIIMRTRRSLVCTITDGTGFITLRFFHFNAKQHRNLEPGTRLSCFGEIRHGFAGLEIIHPEYKILYSEDDCATESCLTPIYPLTEGLRQATVRKATFQALTIYDKTDHKLTEFLPEGLLKTLNYPSLSEALHTLHTPDEKISVADLENGNFPAIQRLAFEEFLAHHLSLKKTREQQRIWRAPVLTATHSICEEFITALPFSFTQAQSRVIQEVSEDCKKNIPMMRLIQGDVGSGKTIVAAYAALLAADSGYQVAIMAPTELLAEQHFYNFKTWMGPLKIKIAFLTGQLKTKEKNAIYQSLVLGEIDIIIGTHALFQDKVEFSRLGLIIIDEQHRFGVHQRLALKLKGQRGGIKPHQLVMTATPIPRTLAMLNYSDLDISTIDELPPGRKPIITSVLSAERRDQVISRISNWVAQGHQAYWVCTLIEDSETLQYEAAEQTLEKLTLALPDIRIALVHGRMKSSDKEQAMQAFKQHKTDLLVATTVIEVGVDVPNAGLMIIENPERLGLSQLHQLRGRVGRGSGDSYCLLMYQPPLSATAHHRLGILRETSNGFIIADEDLKLRGPGDIIGTRQTGQMQFKIADLQRDAYLLPEIQQAAAFLETKVPEAILHIINRWLGEPTHYTEV